MGQLAPTRLGPRRAALVALVAGLIAAPPASALSQPEVFLKELTAGEQTVGDWVPLAGASMHSVTGYDLGVRLQDTGQPGNRQRILVQVTSVPDGHPDQQNIYSLCFQQSGPAGQIARIDEQVRYEGDGPYGLTVTVSTGTDVSTNCAGGPSTSGSFTASARTRVRFVGHLLRLDPSENPPFSGLEIAPPAGAGGTDVRCARDPAPAADGSLGGSLVSDHGAAGAGFGPVRVDTVELVPTVGRWACVARGRGGGVTPGPWSAPTPAQDVQTGFYKLDGESRLVDTRGPTYRMTQRFNPNTAGGKLTVVFRRIGRRGPSVTLRTRIGRGGLASLRFQLPRLSRREVNAGFLESISFGGTRFVAARRSFGDHTLVAFHTLSGRVDVEFPPPCGFTRC